MEEKEKQLLGLTKEEWSESLVTAGILSIISFVLAVAGLVISNWVREKIK